MHEEDKYIFLLAVDVSFLIIGNMEQIFMSSTEIGSYIFFLLSCNSSTINWEKSCRHLPLVSCNVYITDDL